MRMAFKKKYLVESLKQNVIPIKLNDEESHVGKVKQVFDDFVVLEDDANTHMIRKTRINSVIVSKENNKAKK